MNNNICGVDYQPTPYYNNQVGYSYNPATRFQNNYQQPQQFSGYGLISSPNIYQSFGTLGYNPNIQQNYYSTQGTFPQYGNVPNPYYYNPYMNQQPQQLSGYTYVEYGYNPYGNKAMYSSEDTEKLRDILDRMSEEQREYQDRLNSYQMYNYYGYMNTSNPYITEKYKREIRAIEEEAIQRNIEFNKRLSRIAHTILGDELDDEYYDDLYNARDIEVPAEDCQIDRSVNILNSFTVNIKEIGKKQYEEINEKITRECHDSVIGSCTNMIDFLNNAGLLYAEGMQNEVKREKFDKSREYDRNRFNTYLSSQIVNRDGVVSPNLFPNLTQSSSIMDDGTLQIKAPSWMTNAKKESEQSYLENKMKFINAIYNGKGR